MFGKKSSSGGTKKKSVKQGPSVNFFAAHAEKLVLGVVVAVLGYLVYEGVGGKGYDQSRQPTQLSSEAEKLLSAIRSGEPWPTLKEEETRIVKTEFTPRTIEARKPAEPEKYPITPFEVIDRASFIKRADPKLAAPIKVLGQSVVGMIAVEAADNYVDPFEDFEDAPKLKGARRPDRRRNAGGAGASADAAAATGNMMGEPGMAGGPGSTVEQKRYFPPEYNRGFSMASMGGAGGMGGMPGMAGMGGETMGSGGAGMPGGPGMPGSQPPANLGSGAPTVKPKKYKAEVVFLNAVTALVPHEEMVKEYEARLRDSASYFPMRDRPIYLSFEVQRAEVVDPRQPVKDADWKKVTDARAQLSMMKTWLPPKPQTVQEVIDLTCADPALTMPIPPLLFHDYRTFAKHPDIDWIWDAGMAQMQQMQGQIATMTETMKAAEEAAEQLYPGERPGMGGMGAGASGMMGGTEGGMPGMDSGMGMGMGMGMPGASMGMPGGDAMGMTGMAGGMPGMGTETGMGMGMGMGMTGPMIPKYKMVRFYDRLDVRDIGKTYKYRVRLIMEDPNYPSDRYPAPRANDMEDEVFLRVAKLRAVEDPKADAIAKENARITNPKTPRKIFQRTKRETDWSEPSNSIFVRGVDDVYFGKMPKKTGDPQVDAVLVRLDTTKGAYVPLFSFATEDKNAVKTPIYSRGAVISFPKLTTHFAHPLTTLLKEWVDYSSFANPIGNWNTVVDIRGNDPLALSSAKDDPLSDEGEMMVLMSDGRVEVTNEFDDAFWYRGFTYADERERAANTNNNANMNAGGMEGGMMGRGGAP